MDTKIIASLITAVTSLTVSLLTAFFARRNAMQTAQTVEQLKHDLSEIQATRERQDEQLDNVLAALGNASRVIQSLKDAVSKILRAEGNSLTTNEAEEELEETLKELKDTFAAEHSNLEKSEREIFHAAKGIAVDIVFALKKAVNSNGRPADIAATEHRMAVFYRGLLSDCQARLLDAKFNRIYRRNTRDVS